VGERARRLGEARRHHALGRRRVEREAPRQALVGDDRQRVHVAARVDLPPSSCSGRHVLGRADDVAGLRQPRAPLVGAERLGDAEVDDLHPLRAVAVLDDHHVVGLQVAVHDAGGARRPYPRRSGAPASRRGASSSGRCPRAAS
jgi:hypothetical protein